MTSALVLLVVVQNRGSHGTYYFIAAGKYYHSYSYYNFTFETGCYFSLGNHDKAQAMLKKVPELIEGGNIRGKALPTEVFIKKKCQRLFLAFSLFLVEH